MAGEITLIGDKELMAKFATLPDKLQRKALRRGVSKAARVTTKAAKAEAPSETKAMAKAVGYRIYTFRDKSGVGAVIGVKKDAKGKPARFKRGVVRARRGGFRLARKGEQAEAWRNPEKYLHLVLFGHRIATGGTLIRKQREGWTPELVWSTKHRTMVFKHGAPKRTARSKRTGVAGGGTSKRYVAGKNFLLIAAMRTRSESTRIIQIETVQELDRMFGKDTRL